MKVERERSINLDFVEKERITAASPTHDRGKKGGYQTQNNINAAQAAQQHTLHIT